MQEEYDNLGDIATNATNQNSSCCNCLFSIFDRCCSQKDIVILVIGLDNAGKSTLISTIRKDEAHEETSIWGFDQKEWNTRTFRISLYDLGGGKSLRGLWPHYYSKAHGTIFVVDGASDYTLLEASKELKYAMKHPRLARKPCLVVANKLNEGSALHYDELMGVLGPFNTTEQAFIYCDCRLQSGGVVHKDLKLGLDWLLASIKFRFKELQERVQFESAKQIDEERRSLIERRQRSKSYQEEKQASSEFSSIVIPNLKDYESSTHARMQLWIGLGESIPVMCTYEQRTNQGKNIKITDVDFDKSLEPLIKKYEEKIGWQDYTPSQIVEYFGDSRDITTNLDKIHPHLPGQP